jgi:hypothetical protein
MTFHVPNDKRIRVGRLKSDDSYGNNGAFFIRRGNQALRAIASDEDGWEHVSVSLENRCPLWIEMTFIKSLFWDPVDCVVQYHPPESDYVNNHRYCLHLWRPVGVDIIRPPLWMIGSKSIGELV